MMGFGPLFGMLVDRVEALLADKGYDADSTHERFCTSQSESPIGKERPCSVPNP